MKTITVKFEFSDKDLEGYEDCDSDIIMEDFVRGGSLDRAAYEIIESHDIVRGGDNGKP